MEPEVSLPITPLDRILNQLSSVHVLASCSGKFTLILFSYIILGLPSLFRRNAFNLKEQKYLKINIVKTD